MDKKKLTHKWLRRGERNKDLVERLHILNGGSTQYIMKGHGPYVYMPFKTKNQCEMPQRPKRYCSAYPCKNLVAAGERYCTEHRQGQEDKVTDPFYGSARWKKLRAWYLNREPLCVMCGSPAQMVDHIVEIKEGGDQMAVSNLQSLCFRCHNIKSGQVRRDRGPKLYEY